ncbi:GNAT family N-acetyltransferase [Urechidicola vernalis]|uniref:GNAT family N-acetyltransferase n=1 Tax=Urechidicola vernalis TaxID=3075600 RepID=A0ABU2Y8G7_9FLAO|nr:GNAT family N-acetyltransferase [Urechidicola sp. P050]MDT0553949.1 GNAT family N-acetyltransferase [Urechidicola sp. P050]
MDNKETFIRNATSSEHEIIGDLLVRAYSNLNGFPRKNEIPEYYNYLQNIGSITVNDSVELIIACNEHNKIMGAVVFFKSMELYGTDGIAPQQKNASGFRLLAVDEKFTGQGVGKKLCLECIERTRKLNHESLNIHSTKFMPIARKMYAKMGFERSEDLDFSKGDVYVYGYRLYL